MFQDLPASLAISLTMTITFESLFYFLCGKRNKKDLLLVVLVNVVTNPVVVLLYSLTAVLTDWNRFIVTAALEVLAVLTEWYFYRTYSKCLKHPFVFSLSANIFSFTAGYLLWQIITGVMK